MSTIVGRPSVITKATVRKLEAAFRDGMSVSTACYLSGISRSTFYEYMDKDEEFSDKMNLAKAWVIERAKKVIVNSINQGDLASAKWWLERRAREEFGKDSKDEAKEEYARHINEMTDLIRSFTSEDDELEPATE